MKIITPVLTAVSVMFALAACQKDASSDNTTTTSKNKIKTYTEDVTDHLSGRTVQTFNVSYDDKNRITSLVSASGTGDKVLYTYPSDKEFAVELYQANAMLVHTTFYVNTSISLVDSAFQYNDTKDSSTEKFIYNASKQLISVRDYDYSMVWGSSLFDITSYTYDSNGNLTKETDLNTETTYSYDSTIANSITIDPIYIPQPKQLPTKMVYVEGPNTVTTNYTYTFDSNKRLISEKAVSSNGDITIKSYTYY